MILLMIYLFTFKFAQAYNVIGNGGNVVKDNQRNSRFLDQVIIPQRALWSDKMKYALLMKKSLDEVRGMGHISLFTIGVHSNTKLVTAMFEAIQRLNFYLVKGPLAELNDTGKVELPWTGHDGKIYRLAYQDKATLTVEVDRDVLQEMISHYPEDVASFLAHEALIRLYYDDYNNEPLETTQLISTFVHELFKNSYLDSGTIQQYACDMGLMTTDQIIIGEYKELSYGILVREKFPKKMLATFVSGGNRCLVLPVNLDNDGSASRVLVRAYHRDIGPRILQFNFTLDPSYGTGQGNMKIGPQWGLDFSVNVNGRYYFPKRNQDRLLLWGIE